MPCQGPCMYHCEYKYRIIILLMIIAIIALFNYKQSCDKEFKR